MLPSGDAVDPKLRTMAFEGERPLHPVTNRKVRRITKACRMIILAQQYLFVGCRGVISKINHVRRLRHKPLIWQAFSEFSKGNVCISGETRSCFGRGAAFSDINTFWGNGFRLKNVISRVSLLGRMSQIPLILLGFFRGGCVYQVDSGREGGIDH